MTLVRKHFNSTTEYAAWVREPLINLDKEVFYGNSYTGKRRALQGLDLLTTGDETHVSRARDLLSKFQENIEVPIHRWENRPAGVFPNVPAFLAGNPECMWSKELDTSDHSPLRVWVGVTSTWYVTEEQLRDRGVVLAALAIALSEKRPVYITPWIHRGERGSRRRYGRSSEPVGALLSWDLATSPLVLSELMASVADPLITRHLGLPACHLVNPECTDPSAPYHPYVYDEYYGSKSSKVRKALGCADNDLYIPMCEGSDPLLNDPITWLQNTIAKYSQDEDEEEN